MKKLTTLVSLVLFALATTAFSQGPGSGVCDGSGPHGYGKRFQAGYGQGNGNGNGQRIRDRKRDGTCGGGQNQNQNRNRNGNGTGGQRKGNR
ncbi:MAG: hypothetical protein WHU10_12415 [Fimbriimonadales bacterium]